MNSNIIQILRKHFARFHTVIETQVEIWENKKLKWESYFEFSKISTRRFDKVVSSNIPTLSSNHSNVT